MRLSFKYIIFILQLVTANVCLFAQQESSLINLKAISENEKSAFQKRMQPHEALIENNYDLKYHRFFLFADPAQAYINGSVTSFFVPTQAGMSSIQFELYTTMIADSAFHHGVKQNVTHTGNVITIPLGSISPEGALDSVTVYYHGNPPTTSGFGSFTSEAHNGTPVIYTLSEPYGASDWWPSKNDLTDKIDSIDMYVVTPNGNHVASNGLLISETLYNANSVLAHWKHRYPIASYLIAIASTNYARFSDYYKSGTDSLLVLNYVYPEDSTSVRSGAFSALASIALYENLFAPYPFRAEKYGHAEFGWAGGMEHQTMTFLSRGAFNVGTVAHELAHQWFGDMITCGSWHDIWLNEGFATYCAALRYENIEKYSWPVWKRDAINSVCSVPGGSVYCDDTTRIDRIFDGRLSYNKGAMLLHMLRWVVGDEDFFKGMKAYANDPKLMHGFARTSDFKAHMEAASGRDLTDFFADWYTGQGYPIYNVNISQSADHSTRVTINQSQTHPSVSFFALPVPIQFFGENKDTIIVFNHTYSGEVFNVNPGFAIDTTIFDPELWLVSANNTLTLGINDLPAGKQITLMPNPASDFLDVQHNLGKINSIEIMDMKGKQQAIRLKGENQTSFSLNTLKLKSGIYLLRITYNEGVVTRKFIIKR